MAETAETNFDEFKGKDCVFVADWLKTKGLYMLCSVSEDVTFKNDFVPDNVCCLINHVNMPGLRSIREAIEKLKQ